MGTRSLLFSLSILVTGAACAQNLPVSGAEHATLQEIAGTPTLVTVVLKNGDARDPNLQITGLQEKHFNVKTSKGKQYAYLYDMVKEIIVQGGVIEKKPFELSEFRALRAEDQKIVDRAWQRIGEIYDETSALQGQKISAASLLAYNMDNQALTYLNKLGESNDLATQLNAGFALYLAGKEVPLKLIRQGLANSDRRLRAQAAILAGLTGYEEGTPALNKLFQDRPAEYSAPAAQALARLGNREIIPQLLTMLTSLNGRKGEAAVYCLSKLGGEEVIEQMNMRLENAAGEERYRIIRVLHKLEDPNGETLMNQAFNELQLTLKDDFAMILAREGHAAAAQFLRDRLQRREDPTAKNLVFRARIASALYQGGNPSALATLQELLRDGSALVKAAVCALIIELGDRQFLTIIQPSIENTDPMVALAACTTAVCLSNPDIRNRAVELQHQK